MNYMKDHSEYKSLTLGGGSGGLIMIMIIK
jgi:hypothetical protein